jgi:menaquinone-9 beta-reductase
MGHDADVLVVGAGPAGSALSILLAAAGWRVLLVEQHDFPRQKVCGECIAAAGLDLLDRLGVGQAVRSVAGAPLERVAWMRGATTVVADLPAAAGGHPFGRALGRDRLDALLLARARDQGVTVLQPARVRAIRGRAGDYTSLVQRAAVPTAAAHDAAGATTTGWRIRTPVVVDAHGCWEAAPAALDEGRSRRGVSRRPSDMLAFKASFRGAGLAPGLLPVVSLPGACGGIVMAEGGRTTLACCIRRDALQDCRAAAPGLAAGAAVERWMRRHCRGIDEALDGATREGGWLAAGPIRPGPMPRPRCGSFAVGNAAGETHPLIGEGIGMALQSAALLAQRLAPRRPASLDVDQTARLQRDYARAWRAAFMPRLWAADAFAEVAMRPAAGSAASVLLDAWPGLLTTASRLAGKARSAITLRTRPGGLR